MGLARETYFVSQAQLLESDGGLDAIWRLVGVQMNLAHCLGLVIDLDQFTTDKTLGENIFANIKLRPGFIYGCKWGSRWFYVVILP